MMTVVPAVFSPEEAAALRAQLLAAEADWTDGKSSAGWQGAPVKLNRQIIEGSPTAIDAGGRILTVLERHPLFVSAALPNIVYPPMFNRYGEGMAFGLHIDGGVRLNPWNGGKFRTDISATLFLTPPEDYDGGELEVNDTYGVHSVKLAAGDMILYPASSLHQVTPITRGERVSAFFWVQSLVRDDARRALLYEMDGAIQTLNRTEADETARRALVGCYHNLLREWSET